MTDYISREASLAFAKDIIVPTKDGGIYRHRCIDPCDIRDIPAADVRPVVLCRDCQNSYEWANVDGDNYRYCGYLRSRWNHDADRMVDDDDFCKWGRKREES